MDRNHAVEQAITKTEQQITAIYQKRIDAAILSAQKTNTDLSKANAKQLEAKDAQIKTINSKLVAALSELRNRPIRPDPKSVSDVPKPASIVQTCTGRELYREDSEFLTREAARAEALIIERDYYYNAYEEFRNKLEMTNNGN